MRMKSIFLSILIVFLFIPNHAYTGTMWGFEDIEGVKVDFESKVGYIDIDGDFTYEVLMKETIPAGSGHYVEMLRLFKRDGNRNLYQIFSIRTLDSYFGYDEVEGIPNDDISVIEFTEPDIETGLRDIIVKSKTVYYEDSESRIIEKEEDLETKVYKWHEERREFIEHESKP